MNNCLYRQQPAPGSSSWISAPPQRSRGPLWPSTWFRNEGRLLWSGRVHYHGHLRSELSLNTQGSCWVTPLGMEVGSWFPSLACWLQAPLLGNIWLGLTKQNPPLWPEFTRTSKTISLISFSFPRLKICCRCSTIFSHLVCNIFLFANHAIPATFPCITIVVACRWTSFYDEVKFFMTASSLFWTDLSTINLSV